MNKMELHRHIKELLIQHDCVLVPGFGGFVANSCSASIDPATHVFLPPRKEISFNVHLTRNDGLLANHIGMVESCSYSTAMDGINDVVKTWKDALNDGVKVELEEIGTLYKDTHGQVLFEPDMTEGFLPVAFGLTSFQSPPIKRESRQQKIEKQIQEPVEKLTQKVADKSKGKVIPLRRYASAVAASILLALMVWGVTKVELPAELPFHYSELNPFKSKVELTYAPRDEVSVPIVAATPEKGEADVWLETVYREKEEDLAKKEKPKKAHRFFVIGGCFADYDNAERLIRRLKRKGFDAQLVGKNKRSLHRVAYSGYSTRREAKRALLKIKKEQMPSAWLFVKR